MDFGLRSLQGRGGSVALPRALGHEPGLSGLSGWEPSPHALRPCVPSLLTSFTSSLRCSFPPSTRSVAVAKMFVQAAENLPSAHFQTPCRQEGLCLSFRPKGCKRK